jgi:hypothetical protein
MGSLSGITHNLQEYIRSCNEDISRVSREVSDYKRRLADLTAESRLYKIFKVASYKQRKSVIEETLARLEAQLSDLQLEMNTYKRFGLDVPQNIPSYEKIKNLIEARDSKLDVVFLVEMGLM